MEELISLLPLALSGAIGIYLDVKEVVEFKGFYWLIGSLGTSGSLALMNHFELII